MCAGAALLRYVGGKTAIYRNIFFCFFVLLCVYSKKEVSGSLMRKFLILLHYSFEWILEREVV